MATLVLGTVGRALGGPVGGLIGTFLGGAVDRAVLGGGKPREGARLGNLSVQSSAYGEPLPHVFGTLRLAGNLIWTAGIAEAASTSGGGKRSGPRTTSYSYSASFAVALSARAVMQVARVWADGKLLRDASGAWLTPVTMRLHGGGEGQPVDPLIAAAEGVGTAPAYRGLAYAVFEDLPLADYGNRIPNLTFEIVADAGVVDAGAVAAELAAAAGAQLAVAGAFPALGGFVAARSGSAREPLGQLARLFDLRFVDDGSALTVRAGAAAGVATLAADDLGTVAAGSAAGEARRETRAAAGAIDGAVAIGFLDPARDYQPGLQRAARRGGGRDLQVDAPIAIDAADAKRLAGDMLARGAAARTAATLHLPCRGLRVRAGQQVARPGDAAAWAVRRWGFAEFVATLEVERLPVRRAGVAAADAGRVHDAGDAAAGPTTLHILDLPPLFDGGGTVPRVWAAAAGGPGWRRCGVASSVDSGDSYAAVGEISAPSPMGTLVTPLEIGCDDRWDRHSFEVMLDGDAMLLESRSDAAVLAGANLAAIGSEIVQFAQVELVAPGRYRLASLLRGRRGSVAAAHSPGARFVLLDPLRLLAVDLPGELLGRALRFRAVGADDAATPAVALTLAGEALRPFAPVFVRVVQAGGDARFEWRRRSRSGFGWLDGTDAPLGEVRELYRVTLSSGGAMRREVSVDTPHWDYPAAARTADGIAPGATVTLSVAQIGDATGPGAPASATFILN